MLVLTEVVIQAAVEAPQAAAAAAVLLNLLVAMVALER
jgi:hypothetical protein